jgi:hypothetical protein
MACMLVEGVARGPEFGRRFTSGGWISGSICGTQSPGRYVLAVMAAGRQAGERSSPGTPRPPGCAGGLLPRGGPGNAAGHRVLSASWVGLTGQLGNPARAGAGTRPTGSPLCCSKPPGAPGTARAAMRGRRRARARGPGWWLGQPRFEPWHQEQHRWSEDYARKAAEREERSLAGGVHTAGRRTRLRRCSEGQP